MDSAEPARGRPTQKVQGIVHNFGGASGVETCSAASLPWKPSASAHTPLVTGSSPPLTGGLGRPRLASSACRRASSRRDEISLCNFLPLVLSLPLGPTQGLAPVRASLRDAEQVEASYSVVPCLNAALTSHGFWQEQPPLSQGCLVFLASPSPDSCFSGFQDLPLCPACDF